MELNRGRDTVTLLFRPARVGPRQLRILAENPGFFRNEMIPADDPDCALILDPGSPKPDSEIGAAVTSVLGVYKGDAIAAARYGGGVLVRTGPKHALGTIRDRLSEIGVRATVVPGALLSEIPRGHRGTRLEFLDRVCWVRLPNRRELPLKRRDFRGVQIHAALGEVRSPESEKTSPKKRGAKESADENAVNARRIADALVDVGATEMSGRGKQIFEWLRENNERRPQLFLSLYSRDPVGALRFEREDLDYSVLGDRKQRHSLDNFLAFAEWILECLPGLWNHERVEAFLAEPDPESILVFKREEVQNFDAWMQSWIRLKSAGHANAPDSVLDPESDGDVDGASSGTPHAPESAGHANAPGPVVDPESDGDVDGASSATPRAPQDE